MSFPKYPLYKESGVEWLGVLPEHWDISPVRLGAEEINEKNETVAGDYLSLMSGVGIIPYEEKGDIGNKKPDDLSKSKKIKVGDFVINSMNFGIGSFGVSAYDGVSSPVYIVLRPRQSVIDSQFLESVFSSRQFQSYAQSYGNGILAHRSAISSQTVLRLPIPLPPKGEQTTIGAFLAFEASRIDALIAEQQRLIELLHEKRQAVISQAVTKGLDPSVPMKDSGVEWLGDVPVRWTVAKLNHRYVVELGKMLDAKRNVGGCQFPYLRNQDVQWGHVNTDDLPTMRLESDEVSRYTVREGDILVCEGGDVGRAAQWQAQNGEFAYQKALHRLRPRAYDLDHPPYLVYLLFAAKLSGVYVQDDRRATISHLTAESFREYRFPFPPVAEQVAIVEYLDMIDTKNQELLRESQQAIELLLERRAALISAAVTGKIDVRGWRAIPSTANASEDELVHG